MSNRMGKRPCEAKNPATCQWHRNGVMAELHQEAADKALMRGDMDSALFHADEAQAYRHRQDAVDAGDYASVAEITRAEIKADKANASSDIPVLALKGSGRVNGPARPSGFRREELSMPSGEWREIQEMAAKYNVELRFDSVVDTAGTSTARNVVFKGKRNDVMWLHARIGKLDRDRREDAHVEELKQRRTANEAFSNAKRLVRDATLSEAGWRQLQASADELGVKFAGGHYEQQADGSIRLTNVKLEGEDTEVAAINTEIAADTPMEHVARIPSFKEFFGFGKKAS